MDGERGGDVSEAGLGEDVSACELVGVLLSIGTRWLVVARSSFRIALLTASSVLDIPCTMS